MPLLVKAAGQNWEHHNHTQLNFLLFHLQTTLVYHLDTQEGEETESASQNSSSGQVFIAWSWQQEAF